METSNPADKNKETLPYAEIEPTEKFGPGKLYKVGVVEVEIYENSPDGKPSLVRIRAPGASMALSYVSEVKPTNDGGMLIDFGRNGQKVHASFSIGRGGDIAFIYSPPPPPMGMSEKGKTRKVGGIEYTLSTIDIPGTPEGVRIPVKGTVDAAPRPVAPNVRNSPLMFFLIEENPKDPQHPLYHEVWAIKAARQELQRAKFVKGSVVEVILYKHTYNETTIGGDSITITRHHLAKIISAKKPSP